jgi:hypothetical protein
MSALSGPDQAICPPGRSPLAGRVDIVRSERAFHILAWRSQEANVKLRDLVSRFLDVIADGKASADTRSHVDHALLALE